VNRKEAEDFVERNAVSTNDGKRYLALEDVWKLLALLEQPQPAEQTREVKKHARYSNDPNHGW